MKIKNISEKDFEFEGIKIFAGETIEVDIYVGQKLLALYWHNPLELVEEIVSQQEEKIEEKNEKEIETPQPEEIKEEKQEITTEQPSQFVCDKCGKVFTKKVGLVAHQRFCKKYGNN